MEAAAKLITAVAALLAAVAWPIVFAIVLVAYRTEMRAFASRFPTFIDRLRKMKIAGIEAELDALADKASGNGQVTPDQTRAAAQIAIKSHDLGTSHLVSEMDKLCLQYDTIRRTLPAGESRTNEMTRIVVKMRALGPSTSHQIAVYKGSGSAGSRLAAVAMMQMEPARADLNWLLARFDLEAPFIFYHAALALTNAANSNSGVEEQQVLNVSRLALAKIRSFDGTPDQGTLDVLESLAAR